MKKLAALTVSAATIALVLNGGAAAAKDGESSTSSGTWPASLPLPTSPGTVLSQSSSTAVVRSTDSAYVVQTKLDDLYVTQKGCRRTFAVNKPRDYFCVDPATGRTVEVWFTFASLDPVTSGGWASQTNA